MCSVRFTLSTHYRREVARHLKTAQQLGHLRQVKFLLAILAVMDGQSFAEVALILRVHEKTIAAWDTCSAAMGSRARRAKNLQAARPS